MSIRPKSHKTGDIAETIAKEAFLRAGWTVDTPQSDYGYDLLLKLVEAQEVRPYTAWVQVRGSSISRPAVSPRRRIRTSELSHWLTNPVPVLLCGVEIWTRKTYVLTAREVLSLLRSKHGSGWNAAKTRWVQFPKHAVASKARHREIRRQVSTFWVTFGSLTSEIEQTNERNAKTFAAALDSRNRVFNLNEVWAPSHAIAIGRRLGFHIEMLKFAVHDGALARGIVDAYSDWLFPVILIVRSNSRDSEEALKYHPLVVGKTRATRTTARSTLALASSVAADGIVTIEGSCKGKTAVLEIFNRSSQIGGNSWRFSIDDGSIKRYQTQAQIAYALLVVPTSHKIRYTSALLDHFPLFFTFDYLLGRIQWKFRLVSPDRVPTSVRRLQLKNQEPRSWWWQVQGLKSKKSICDSFCNSTVPFRTRKWFLVVHDVGMRQVIEDLLTTVSRRFRLISD